MLFQAMMTLVRQSGFMRAAADAILEGRNQSIQEIIEMSNAAAESK